MLRRFLSLMVVLTIPVVASAAESQTGFVTKEFANEDKSISKYVVFVPAAYDGKTEFPVILFLHGSGETKGGTKMPVEVGLGPVIKKQEKTFPYIVVIPQAEKRPWSAGSVDGKRAMQMLDDTMKAYKTDAKRVILTGLSMGGYRARVRRRQREGRREDQGHSLLELPRRQRHRRESGTLPDDDRSAEESRRQTEVHRVRRRRPQQLGRRLRRQGIVEVARGAEEKLEPSEEAQ